MDIGKRGGVSPPWLKGNTLSMCFPCHAPNCCESRVPYRTPFSLYAIPEGLGVLKGHQNAAVILGVAKRRDTPMCQYNCAI